MRRRTGRTSFRYTWPLHAMLLPCIAVMLLFNTYPLILGVIISLKNFRPALGIQRSRWVGLDNFRYIFMLPDTGLLFRNTLVIAVGKIILTQLLALLFALFINEVRNQSLRRAMQTITCFPHFLSWVILSVVFRSILSNDGTLNVALMNLGVVKEPIWFLGSNNLFQPVLIATEAWKEFGYAAVIYIAALTSINPELYEAAIIDGASRFRRMLHITIPGLSSTIALVAALQIANILNAGFEQVYTMYSPVVYESGDIIDTYVYRMGIQSAQYSVATAVGLTKSAVCFVLIMASNYLASRFGERRLF